MCCLKLYRCMNCKEFDATGYPPDSSGLDKLQVGFCKVWKSDTQAFGTCHYSEPIKGKENESEYLEWKI